MSAGRISARPGEPLTPQVAGCLRGETKREAAREPVAARHLGMLPQNHSEVHSEAPGGSARVTPENVEPDQQRIRRGDCCRWGCAGALSVAGCNRMLARTVLADAENR